MFDEQNDNKLVAFVDGFVTNEPDLTDEMYEKASMHDESGAWQMIFGVNTIPAYLVLPVIRGLNESSVS